MHLYLKELVEKQAEIQVLLVLLQKCKEGQVVGYLSSLRQQASCLEEDWVTSHHAFAGEGVAIFLDGVIDEEFFVDNIDNKGINKVYVNLPQKRKDNIIRLGSYGLIA